MEQKIVSEWECAKVIGHYWNDASGVNGERHCRHCGLTQQLKRYEEWVDVPHEDVEAPR